MIKSLCLQVVWVEGKGRHGVATRDVALGEVGGASGWHQG